MRRSLERLQIVPAPLEEAFVFFAEARNLEAITPRWLRFRIISAPERLEQGALLEYRLRLFGAPIRWQTEIVAWQPPHGFTDLQVHGPYPLWEHTHRLTAVDGGTEIYDHVSYRLPLEPFASLFAPLTVRLWLDAILDYRRERVAALLRAA